MRTFKDSKKREWKIDITLGDAMRVKKELGVDILQPENPSEGSDQTLADRLMTDGLMLAELIACLLKPQFEKQNISYEEMLESFDAETIAESTKAFFEEMIDFFRRSLRPHREQLIRKAYQTLNEGIRIVGEKLSSIDTKSLVERMEAEADRIFGKQFGDMAVSSGSIREA